MMGSVAQPGLMPRVLDGIYEGIAQRTSTEYLIRCSYLEARDDFLLIFSG